MFDPAMTTILISRDDRRRYADAERRAHYRRAAAASRTTTRGDSTWLRVTQMLQAIAGRKEPVRADLNEAPCCEPATCEPA